MEQVKVFYDHEGNTLTVWFGEPGDEHVDEETADDVILIKDRAGRVIGFEKLNFRLRRPINCMSRTSPSADDRKRAIVSEITELWLAVTSSPSAPTTPGRT